MGILGNSSLLCTIVLMKKKIIAITIFILAIAGGIFFFQTRAHAPVAPGTPIVEEPSKPEPVVVPKEPITYSSVVLITDTPAKELIGIIGKDNLAMVLSLNRIDERHLRKDGTIIIPSRFDEPTALTAFPLSIPELAQTPKMMLISQRVQEFGAYEYGTLVRFGGLSSGKKSTPTANKLYHANWKGKEVISTVDDEWILKWNVNVDNFDGIGIHEYELPGYPASHSCVRLSAVDAEWFYNWIDQWTLSEDGQSVVAPGTPVIIFGDYPFGQTAPWKTLTENKDALKISIEEIPFGSSL